MNERKPSPRIVVTGLGVVSSIGIGWPEFWTNLLAGKSGVSKITSIDPSSFRSSYGGEVKNFKPEKFISDKTKSSYGRTSQFAIAAAQLALNDANINHSKLKSERLSIVIGTTNGESEIIQRINDKWVKEGEQSVDPTDVLRYPGNVISLNVSKELNIKANCSVIPTACAAGNYAIGYGYDQIQSGRATIALVGGADGFSRIALSGFDRLFAIAPEKCQPFDKNRKGIIVGEGAGILVLETYEHAIQRSAKIYAEILGYALSCDASHMTIPSEDGIAAVMAKAMTASNTSPDKICYISAHGTGTPMNDKTESAAINRVFGSFAQNIPVSSIKSMLGHTMGAASALEAIACALAVKESKIPPTINNELQDEECRIDCVPNAMRTHKVDVALNNSFAFGGNNACLVIGRLS